MAVIQLLLDIVLVTCAAVYNSSVAVLEAIVETLTSVTSAFWNPVVSTAYFGRFIRSSRAIAVHENQVCSGKRMKVQTMNMYVIGTLLFRLAPIILLLAVYFFWLMHAALPI